MSVEMSISLELRTWNRQIKGRPRQVACVRRQM